MSLLCQCVVKQVGPLSSSFGTAVVEEPDSFLISRFSLLFQNSFIILCVVSKVGPQSSSLGMAVGIRVDVSLLYLCVSLLFYGTGGSARPKQKQTKSSPSAAPTNTDNTEYRVPTFHIFCTGHDRDFERLSPWPVKGKNLSLPRAQ